MALRAEALTPKDREDLVFAIKAGVDYIALSFVRQPSDLDQARAAMAEAGRQVPIISKLEKPEAIARLDAILEKSDGVMVARGDLGVELPPEEVPAIQKDIIRRANLRGLPVIVATQMLNSMIEHPRPTRAEASDVANAVYDGADALMLSGETASGSYPVESVRMMERIILAGGERGPDPRQGPGPHRRGDLPCLVPGRHLRGRLRGGAHGGGGGDRRLHPLRRTPPGCSATTGRRCPSSPSPRTRRCGGSCRFSGAWCPRVLEPVDRTEEMVRRVEEELLSRGFAHRGDRVVIVYGAPVGQPGKINSMRLARDRLRSGLSLAGERELAVMRAGLHA